MTKCFVGSTNGELMTGFSIGVTAPCVNSPLPSSAASVKPSATRVPGRLGYEAANAALIRSRRLMSAVRFAGSRKIAILLPPDDLSTRSTGMETPSMALRASTSSNRPRDVPGPIALIWPECGDDAAGCLPKLRGCGAVSAVDGLPPIENPAEFVPVDHSLPRLTGDRGDFRGLPPLRRSPSVDPAVGGSADHQQVAVVVRADLRPERRHLHVGRGGSAPPKTVSHRLPGGSRLPCGSQLGCSSSAESNAGGPLVRVRRPDRSGGRTARPDRTRRGREGPGPRSS